METAIDVLRAQCENHGRHGGADACTYDGHVSWPKALGPTAITGGPGIGHERRGHERLSVLRDGRAVGRVVCGSLIDESGEQVGNDEVADGRAPG